jgi:Transposase-associated domain
MYGIKWDTSEYIRCVEEFLDCATEDMNRRGDHTIPCPYRDCQNLRRFQNVGEIRVHLIVRGFKERYIRLIWHGENLEQLNIRTNIVISNAESDGENLDPATSVLDDTDDKNVNLDDMMNEVTKILLIFLKFLKFWVMNRTYCYFLVVKCLRKLQ